jgi:hypothetical protein
MSGHHDVRVFRLRPEADILSLPDNWKPFAIVATVRGPAVVCRKWVRDEKTTKEEPST